MIFFLSLLLSLFIIVPHVQAIYDPLSVPNNKYGIHIVDTGDIPDLNRLINTSGGDWGYVTMVLSDADHDHDRWQTIFNEMRRTHLIPIVRLATHVENGSWTKPQKDRFYEIVNLLNGLNWPTENRYVILFNEPNHANEWGGTIDPAGYAETVVNFTAALKNANKDFFVLPAGLDASSANENGAISEADYLSQMIAAKPEVFTVIDGWTSHSYPNPGFSGSPIARGQGTLATFDWELSYLKSLGVSKNLPVFITETGWQHSEGKNTVYGLLSSDQVGTNMQTAAGGIWADPRIVAVTPFIYNYQDVPFDHFSWRMMGSNGFYPQYGAYLSIVKLKGEPKQHESYSLLSDILPAKLIAGSVYALSAIVENNGQGILGTDNGYSVSVTSIATQLTTFVDPVADIEPGQTGQLMVHIKTPQTPGAYPITITADHNSAHILLQTRTVEIIPPPSVTVRAHLGWRHTNDAENVSVLIYDKDTLLQKFSGLPMRNGDVTADHLVNIIPGLPYRVVMLVPGYLPRQVIGNLGPENTVMYPNRFLPLDFNGDGAFTKEDLITLLQFTPWIAVLRFFGP